MLCLNVIIPEKQKNECEEFAEKTGKDIAKQLVTLMTERANNNEN